MTATLFEAAALTPTQLAARRRADQLLDDTYPGQYVAYLDDWVGEDIRRTVVVTGRGPAEFQRILASVDSETRRKMQITRVPDAGVVSVPSVTIN